MNIRENLELLYRSIPPYVQVIVVSKTQGPETIKEVYSAGHRAFGENKVQELTSKASALPADIRWHFIGHLQTNKVRLIVPFIHMIHSIDSLKLLKEVDKEAGRIDRMVTCLLQMHIATEETKFGLDLQEIFQILGSPDFKTMSHIRIHGLMGMATFTDNEGLVRQEFRSLRDNFMKIKTKFFPHDTEFNELSMGMSGDYGLAIEEGSTMIRIGTAIFGERLKPLNPVA
ncbi:MAG: YggS family pyridoxal phosphate-dependent enzyme [Bacteroidetes bacterium]|nr:YggS family pyridoxal phosphate-dependent enzyme [Bacteroidota bacterium]